LQQAQEDAVAWQQAAVELADHIEQIQPVIAGGGSSLQPRNSPSSVLDGPGSARQSPRKKE
jgi:hypothetical protein